MFSARKVGVHNKQQTFEITYITYNRIHICTMMYKYHDYLKLCKNVRIYATSFKVYCVSFRLTGDKDLENVRITLDSVSSK